MSSKTQTSKTLTASPQAKTTFTDPNANSFSDRILRWELLENKLAPALDTMPHVKPAHAELVQLLSDAKALEFRLKGQKAAARQVAIDRRAMVKKGEALRSRLASALAFEHGSTSVLLTEFGLRPRRAGGRRRKPAPPATAQTEPPAGTGAPEEGSGGAGQGAT